MASDSGSAAAPPDGEDAFEQRAEALRDLLIGQLVAKATSADRAELHGRAGAGAVGSGSQPDHSTFWTRLPPRARKPRISRDELAAAAVRLADTEGLEALSMRRLAADLGVGTMTLYHYVQTKAEVLALALDTAMGEMIFVPGELSDDWREAMTQLAHRTRAVARRHPWMTGLHGTVPYGPSSVLHYDQSLQAVRDLEATLEAKLDVVVTVDEFVFGYCLTERTGIIQPRTPELLDYISTLLETGAYPEFARLVEEEGLVPLWDRLRAHTADEARFHRNLERLLDGMAASMTREQ